MLQRTNKVKNKLQHLLLQHLLQNLTVGAYAVGA